MLLQVAARFLGPARFSRVRSVLGKAIFFFAVHVPRSLRGLTSRLSRASSCSVTSPPRPPFSSLAADCLSRTRFIFIPPITPTPRRWCARARTRCTVLVRSLRDRRTRANASSHRDRVNFLTISAKDSAIRASSAVNRELEYLEDRSLNSFDRIGSLSRGYTYIVNRVSQCSDVFLVFSCAVFTLTCLRRGPDSDQ